MALLNILRYPDPRLRAKAEIVETVDVGIQKIVDDMFETMYEAHGVGLAAIQVNVQKCIMVMDVSDTREQPLCFINPEIIHEEGHVALDEGCLSFPGVYATVTRPEKLTVKALDREGKPFELDAEGLLAKCIHHENDHLEGKLFVDYLSPLKRQRIKKKLQKMARQTL